jgi:hypothetical protein
MIERMLFGQDLAAGEFFGPPISVLLYRSSYNRCGSNIGRQDANGQTGKAGRQARIKRAIASVGLEGLEPTDTATLIFDRYVSGELTIEQMGTEIRALNAREFGPAHVSPD